MKTAALLFLAACAWAQVNVVPNGQHRAGGWTDNSGLITAASGRNVVIGNTVSASNLPISVTAPPYNAKGDCSTDDTTAIQAAINAGALAGTDVFLPSTGYGKCYKFTKLYFYYDVALNPGYPQAAGRGFRFYGAGQMEAFYTAAQGTYQRTVLVSTDTTGPALNIDGGAGYATRAASLDNFTVIVGNSTWAILAKRFNSYSWLKNLTIAQTGTGGGMFLQDVWSQVRVENVQLSGASSITTGSVGFKACNTIDAGAITTVGLSTATHPAGTGGFDRGIQFGVLPADSDAGTCAAKIDTVTQINSDPEGTNTGYVLGSGVWGMNIIAPHAERYAKRGMTIGGINSGITVQGGFFFGTSAVDADIYIEGDVNNSQQNGIKISGTQFLDINNYGIWINSAQYSNGIVENCSFSRATGGGGSKIGIQANGPGMANWIALNPIFSGLSTNFNNGGNFGLIVNNNNNGAVTISGALTVIGNGTVGGGSNTVFRCATAGTLPAGALTITSGSCGTTADTGLRVK